MFASLSEQFLLYVLVGVLIATIFLAFLFPKLTHVTQTSFWDNLAYKVGKVKKHKLVSGFLLLAAVSGLVGAYLWYQTTQPIVLTAAAFKQREAKALDFTLKSTQYNIITKGDLLVIDVRSEKEFLAAHTQNSFNVPVANFKQNRVLLQIKGKKVVVFANKADFPQALKVANYIKARLTKQKVYVIKDGYENMKTIGLPLVRGDQYESEPINEK